MRTEFLESCGHTLTVYPPSELRRQDAFIARFLETGRLSASVGEGSADIRAAVRVLTEDDHLGNGENYRGFDNASELLESFRLYKTALEELISVKSGSREETLQLLEGFLNREDCLIEGLYESLMGVFCGEARISGIKHPKSYMKTCILNALRQGGEE